MMSRHFLFSLLAVTILGACSHPQPFGVHRLASGARIREVANPGALEIDPTAYERIVAISDVHGMAQPLDKLLQSAGIIDANKQWSGGRTLLLVVGDSIDKGPQSLDVLDRWIALSRQAPAAGGRLVHLLGNHEAEFLANPNNNPKAAAFLAELAARHVPVSELLDPATPRGGFLAGEVLAARLGRWLFCHSGNYPNMPWVDFKNAAAAVLSARNYADPLLSAPEGILEGREWWKNPLTRLALEDRLTANGFAGVVHGHQPKAYGIRYRIGAVDGGKLIKVDTGMAPDANSSPGQVLRFLSPAELTASEFPHAEVVSADGSVAPLVPEVAGLSEN